MEEGPKRLDGWFGGIIGNGISDGGYPLVNGTMLAMVGGRIGCP